MFQLYNRALRDAATPLETNCDNSSADGENEEDTFDGISSAKFVPFVTTIHLIASGITKLSRVQPAVMLYRGLRPKKALPGKFDSLKKSFKLCALSFLVFVIA